MSMIGSTCSSWPVLGQPYPSGFRPLPALGETEGYAFTFIEGREPGWRESRDVNEYVLPPSRAMKP
jgi:hypothetical protein